MKQPIIELNHVTKEYKLGNLTSLKQSVLNGASRLIGRRPVGRERFKALDDISFKIQPGEVVGIIGSNGAGKSTLLKHLAHISNPTQGEVIVRGSVAPLIEVGAGLNPELTGRENIFLNGAILGVPKKVIKQKLDDIIGFAELEQFIDTPVKRYSSGMAIKLGFSIATSIDADILIVDEVLAVGDMAFQRKSFDRMDDLIRKNNKTVLIVSHNIRQVERLCQRVLLLDRGKVLCDSDSVTSCNMFYYRSNEKILTDIAEHAAAVRGSDENSISLEKVELLNEAGEVISNVEYKREFTVSLTFETPTEIKDTVFGVGIHTTDLLYLANQDTQKNWHGTVIPPGRFVVNCTIRDFPFLPGLYSLRFGVYSGEVKLYYAENIIQINVVSKEKNMAYVKEQGFVDLDVSWGFKQDREIV